MCNMVSAATTAPVSTTLAPTAGGAAAPVTALPTSTAAPVGTTSATRDAVAGANGGPASGAVGGVTQIYPQLLAMLTQLMQALNALVARLQSPQQGGPVVQQAASAKPVQQSGGSSAVDAAKGGATAVGKGDVDAAKGGIADPSQLVTKGGAVDAAKGDDLVVDKLGKGKVAGGGPLDTSTVELGNVDAAYAARLTSSTGNFVELWGDPHVNMQVDGQAYHFDIGYGPGDVQLSDGTHVQWDTFAPGDAHQFILKSFRVDSPGTAGDAAVQTTDGKDESHLHTALTDTQLRELAVRLKQYEGPISQPLAVNPKAEQLPISKVPPVIGGGSQPPASTPPVTTPVVTPPATTPVVTPPAAGDATIGLPPAPTIGADGLPPALPA